ncbi:uncharacterized protein BXZ73DRAFT_13542, partial [Epithele typhae]|uniref:uncharacterized protein n=1 Tax=Epithele typhae TaxID=378194 RepID=UPI002007CE7C
TNPRLCGVLKPPPHFTHVLSRMPNLYSVTTSMPWVGQHGVPWLALKVVLSAPSLRELCVHSAAFSLGRLTPTEAFEFTTIAPLKSFKYALNRYPLYKDHPAPLEVEVLSVLLKAVCETLETLELTVASAPLDVLKRLRWPNLLKLSGRPKEPLTESYASQFANMSKLRTLNLQLHLKDDRVGLTVASTIPQSEFPWPDLEELYLPLPLTE